MKTQILIYTLLLSLFTSTLLAKDDVQETITLRKNIEQVNRMYINNYNYKMKIEPLQTDSIILKIKLSVEGIGTDNYAELKTSLKNIIFEHKRSEFRVDNHFYDQMRSIGMKTTIKLKNGKTIQMEDLKIEYVLFVPIDKEIMLISKYGDIDLCEYDGVFKAHFYDCKVKTEALLSEALIDVKYGSLDIKEANEIQINSYDSKIITGELGNLVFVSKYSDFKCDGCGKTRIESYDDKLGMGKLGQTFIKAKYSEFSILRTNTLSIDLYDCKLKCEKADDVVVKSRYSVISISNLYSYGARENYDDEIILGDFGKFEVAQSKYTNYKIESISEDIQYNAYDCKMEIKHVGEEFGRANLEAKYGSIRMGIDDSNTYSLKAEMKYGKLKVDESKFESFNREKEGSITHITGKTKAGKSDSKSSNSLMLNTYDVTVTIE